MSVPLLDAVREYAFNGHVNNCRVAYRHCTCGYDDLQRALSEISSKGSDDTTACIIQTMKKLLVVAVVVGGVYWFLKETQTFELFRLWSE